MKQNPTKVCAQSIQAASRLLLVEFLPSVESIALSGRNAWEEVNYDREPPVNDLFYLSRCPDGTCINLRRVRFSNIYRKIFYSRLRYTIALRFYLCAGEGKGTAEY